MREKELRCDQKCLFPHPRPSRPPTSIRARQCPSISPVENRWSPSSPLSVSLLLPPPPRLDLPLEWERPTNWRPLPHSSKIPPPLRYAAFLWPFSAFRRPRTRRKDRDSSYRRAPTLTHQKPLSRRRGRGEGGYGRWRREGKGRLGWYTLALQWENAFTACCLLLPLGYRALSLSAVSGHRALKYSEPRCNSIPTKFRGLQGQLSRWNCLT